MTAEPNVTTPTPADMLALREPDTVTCGCWRCSRRDPDGTLHLSRSSMSGLTVSPYRCEGEAWTPVDEHDEGPP